MQRSPPRSKNLPGGDLGSGWGQERLRGGARRRRRSRRRSRSMPIDIIIIIIISSSSSIVVIAIVVIVIISTITITGRCLFLHGRHLQSRSVPTASAHGRGQLELLQPSLEGIRGSPGSSLGRTAEDLVGDGIEAQDHGRYTWGYCGLEPFDSPQFKPGEGGFGCPG